MGSGERQNEQAPLSSQHFQILDQVTAMPITTVKKQRKQSSEKPPVHYQVYGQGSSFGGGLAKNATNVVSVDGV